MLDGVTMEMFGGETIAIMYTCGGGVRACTLHTHVTEDEVRTLLGLIGNTIRTRGNVEGQFSINGIAMSSRSLGE